MPILKVRQTNDTWFDIRKLTLDKLDLGNGVELSSKTGNNKLLVNEKEILDQEDYNTLNASIEANTTNIEAIKEKLTELTKFCEINSPNGELDLTEYLEKYTKIHAFINFNGEKPNITYGTDKYTAKGDDIGSLEKAEICEMDAYKYGEKFYIIWKNWG